jgi:hypothetical protein
MATRFPTDLIGEHPLQLFPRAVATLLRTDLEVDGAEYGPPRLLASYFTSVRVVDSPEAGGDLSQAQVPPFCVVALDTIAMQDYHSGNLTPGSVVVTIKVTLPAYREDERHGNSRGGVIGAIWERLRGDRYGVGFGKLVHPDYMQPSENPVVRPIIGEGMTEGLTVTGANAPPGEDPYTDFIRVAWRIRLIQDRDTHRDRLPCVPEP